MQNRNNEFMLIIYIAQRKMAPLIYIYYYIKRYIPEVEMKTIYRGCCRQPLKRILSTAAVRHFAITSLPLPELYV